MTENNSSENNSSEKNTDTAPKFMLRGQYVKDLSFENPSAPQSILNLQSPPDVEMSVDLSAQKLQDEVYEMTMQFTVKATSDKKTVFLTELSYAGIFVISNIPEDKLDQVLMVDGAFLLFPFARRVVADITRDGGFPPLLMEPIDFFRLFQEKSESGEKETETSAE